MSEQPEQKETADQSAGETTTEATNNPSTSEDKPAATDTRPQDEQTGEGTGSRAGEYS